MGAGGEGAIKYFLQRREPGSNARQVLHRAYSRVPMCVQLQLGFQQLGRLRPCVARTSYDGN